MERVVVIGASAGGIPALKALCADLPSDFSAPILIVMHVAPQGNDLVETLARCCRLPVAHALDGQYAEAGHILVAAPGLNLTVVDDDGRARVKLSAGGDPNLLLPAIDPLFMSAAAAFQRRVVGIVLSGFLDDGSAGLRAIKAAGGGAIVQDPLDAQCPDMPAAAIRAVAVDSILRADVIGHALAALVAAPLPPPSAPGRVAARPAPTIEVGGATILASSALPKE